MNHREKQNIGFDIAKEIVKNQKKYLFFILIFTIISSACLSVGTYLDKKIVDSIQRLEMDGFLLYLIFSFGMEIIFASVSNQLEVKKMEFSYQTSIQFTKKIIEKIKNISFEVLEERKNLDCMERVYALSEEVSNSVDLFLQLFSKITLVVSYAVVLGTVAWYFPIITIVLALPYFYMLKLQGLERYRQEVEISTDTRKLSYLFQVLSEREYQKEIKTFHLTKYLYEKYFGIRKKLWEKRKKLLMRHSFMMVVVTLVKNSSFLICMYITCMLVLKQETSIGSFILLISVIDGLRNSTLEILEILGEYNEKGIHIKDIDTFMLFSEEYEGEKKVIKDKTIHIENISFAYPNSKHYVIHDLSTTIHKNEIVAVVGENGSGKSTFIHLLLGLYQPNNGKIWIGDALLQEVVEDMREKTGCLLQNFNRYQGTIAENLVGNKQMRREEFEQVKGLLEFVEELPKHWDTPLGQFDEEGIDLSGGNWQRIALARALLKSESEFLILDEPVSSFDPKIENIVNQQIREFCSDKTAILISHRLSITRVCDRILVFDKGQIIEDGTHDDLMKQQGKYYEMYMAQQNLYKV